MPEIRDHLFDGVFHAVELAERRVDLDHLVGEQAREPGVVACIEQLGLSDGFEHALGGRGIRLGIALAQVEILLQGHDILAGAFITGCEVSDDIHRKTFRVLP